MLNLKVECNSEKESKRRERREETTRPYKDLLLTNFEEIQCNCVSKWERVTLGKLLSLDNATTLDTVRQKIKSTKYE